MPVRRILSFALLLGGFTVGGCVSDPRLSTASVYADRPDATDRDLPRRELPIEGHRVPGAEPPPPPTGVLSIGDAITRAVTFNPSLKSAFLEIEAKHGEETQAAVKPNPELALELEDFGGNKATKGFQSAQETLQISQLVELGDKRIARLRSAHLDAAVAGWDYETARVQVITKAAETFR